MPTVEGDEVTNAPTGEGDNVMNAFLFTDLTQADGRRTLTGSVDLPEELDAATFSSFEMNEYANEISNTEKLG